MNIVLDVGNTFIKIGAFEKDTILWAATVEHTNDVLDLVRKHVPTYVFISSVRESFIVAGLAEICEVIYFTQQMKIPIALCYKTPETLGTDRIAAGVGASVLFPAQNTLVFDIGTCLTHGVMDESKTFLGGSISSGLDMRLKALAHFTAKLPLVEFKDVHVELTGKSTAESILSGVLNGMQFEIEGFIAAYRNKYPNMNVLLTGGNASLFEKRLKEPIFVVAELNLIGLNRILNHNV
jgi:type III pantothenate kinase